MNGTGPPFTLPRKTAPGLRNDTSVPRGHASELTGPGRAPSPSGASVHGPATFPSCPGLRPWAVTPSFPTRALRPLPTGESPRDLPAASPRPHALPGSQPGFLAPAAFDPAAPPRSCAHAALAVVPGPLPTGGVVRIVCPCALQPPAQCLALSHPRGINKDTLGTAAWSRAGRKQNKT